MVRQSPSRNNRKSNLPSTGISGLDWTTAWIRSGRSEITAMADKNQQSPSPPYDKKEARSGGV